MKEAKDLLAAAALTERAYRLALVLHSEDSLEAGNRQFIAGELVDVLDEARVALLSANGSPKLN